MSCSTFPIKYLLAYRHSTQFEQGTIGQAECQKESYRSTGKRQLIHFLFKPKGILERLDAGEVVIGDGGYLFALEKRGYLKAGPYTPECVIEFPDAGKQFII